MPPGVRDPGADGAREPLRVLLPMLVTAATIVVAGCGTSVQQHEVHYSAQLRGVGGLLYASVGAVLRDVTPSARASTAATAVGSFEARVAQVELELHALHAPATVSSLHRRAIHAIADYGAAVRSELKSLKSPDPAAVAAGSARFAGVTRAMRAQVMGLVDTIEFVLANPPSAGSG